MPQDTYKDLYHCMHFVDESKADLDSEWDKYFINPKVEGDDTTATHQTKFDLVEDGFNSQWQEVANFGKRLIIDKS